jgi:CheY-like chemotaxis protein
MEKSECPAQVRERPAAARRSGSKPAKKVPKPKVKLAFDRAEVAKIIDQIRQEVEFHHGCAAEVRAKLEKLTGTAFSELLKVKELKRIILRLLEHGQNASPAGTAGTSAEAASSRPAPEPKEGWMKELDRELEKLLVIKKLLEVSPSAPAEKRDPPTAPAEPDGAKTILVVDDDPTTLKLISHFLEKENYRVRTSKSGLEGLQKAFQETPDLILLDVMMPDLDGFQFLSIFRQNRENARTPVVFLSSLAEEADVLKGLEIGAVDYVTKPFSPQVLMAKIKKSLNSRP